MEISSKESSGTDDPISSAAKGATEGVLNWSEQKIRVWIEKLRNRELAFIEDSETIDIAKEIRKRGEYDFFKQYVENNDFRILFQMGLTLKKLEDRDEHPEENKLLRNLKQKIRDKYNIKGLHIAYFVQNGCFSRYVGNVLDKSPTIQMLKFEIENLFKNIDNTVVFVSGLDKVNINQKADEIITKILANSPKTFIISSTGSATDICKKIKNKVIPKISGYDFEVYESKDKRIYFLNRIDDIL